MKKTCHCSNNLEAHKCAKKAHIKPLVPTLTEKVPIEIDKTTTSSTNTGTYQAARNPQTETKSAEKTKSPTMLKPNKML